MIQRNGLLLLIATAAVLLCQPGAQAGWVRYHYAVADPTGAMVLSPPDAAGEQLGWFGRVRQSCACPLQPTCVVPLCHPCSGMTLSVPLSLPFGTPVIEHRRYWVIYNYGSYSVQVHFLPDGSVDVIYSSGLMRAVSPG